LAAATAQNLKMEWAYLFSLQAKNLRDKIKKTDLVDFVASLTAAERVFSA